MTQTKQRPRGIFRKTIGKTLINTAEHSIGKSAAALTYYLLFAMLPLLIFVSNLLGLLELNVASITNALLPIMPDDVYVENFGSYSVIYGARGTVIVLLVWLYMTSFILILGAEFNAALIAIKEDLKDNPGRE